MFLRHPLTASYHKLSVPAKVNQTLMLPLSFLHLSIYVEIVHSAHSTEKPSPNSFIVRWRFFSFIKLRLSIDPTRALTWFSIVNNDVMRACDDEDI